MKAKRLGLEVVVSEKNQLTTTTHSKLPSELLSIENVMKRLSAALEALERDIKQDMRLSCISIADIQAEPGKSPIETVGETLEEGLELLSKVGLNDAFLFLRSYEQLSDGQKYRYKIGKMIESQAQFWIMDEFAATLDRDTAKIVAYNLQKLARQQGKAVLATTTHTDLLARAIFSKCVVLELLKSCSKMWDHIG
jgi:ABC-type ATPase with predicted acetyltransferase domain